MLKLEGEIVGEGERRRGRSPSLHVSFHHFTPLCLKGGRGYFFGWGFSSGGEGMRSTPKPAFFTIPPSLSSLCGEGFLFLVVMFPHLLTTDG